jgi:hypothetical protein
MRQYFFFLCLVLALPARAQRPEPCAGGDCDCMFDNAMKVWKAGDYEMAINKLNAWKTCDPKRSAEADQWIIKVFRSVDELKNAADSTALRAYANDLAYKSQIALRDGDRTTAFRLAEFAHRYVQEGNPAVTRALVEALYYNDHPDSTHRLPWASNIEGHLEGVTSVCFSPDGKRLATGSSDHTAKIWDLESGKVSLTLEGHSSSVLSVSFSPDGKRLATGSSDHTAKIWDLETPPESGQGGKVSLTLEGHSSRVLSVSFSPDGKRLATGSSDHTAKIWDLESGKVSLTLEGHSSSVWSVAFSPDGKRLATGSDDKTAKLWDLTPPGSVWVGGREKKLAGLTQPQLSQYGLENLLDQKPGNEDLLVASKNTWQIAAFADLYADKIRTGFPKTADYARALRLYQACLASGVDNRYFEQRMADLEELWREKSK